MSRLMVKTCPVVDFEDAFPSFQSGLFGIVHMFSANMVKGADVFVNAGNAFVEDERVGR